ncbi:MAG: hypothetical protein IT329_08075 [Caldilineaceae bacterium]|nr:hypothetical protein [Caldilineaceae bacterium]
MHWPELAEPYAAALREAAALILDRFDVWGIVAAGTPITGNPDRASDLDIQVIHARLQRQRIQRWCNRVPVEIFVNPPSMIRRYFADERDRPCTAQMLAAGVVVLDRHPVVAELCAEARTWLATPPNLTPAQLTARRYGAADAYENAQDIQGRDPANARLILHEAVRLMLEYAFLSANRPLPRVKTKLVALVELNPSLGQLARDYYLASSTAQSFALAAAIAAQTIYTAGFFEWESPLEEVSA